MTTSGRGAASRGADVSAELGNETYIPYCLKGLAAWPLRRTGMVRAARLWGAAEALLEKIEAAVHNYVPDRSSIELRG